MEYILVLSFQAIGIGFNVMQKIIALGNDYPELKRSEIISTFFKKDWDTMCVSALIVALDVLVHFVLNVYEVPFTGWEYYPLVSFGIALVLGYAGQRMIYKYLGSAERYLDQKVNEKLQ